MGLTLEDLASARAETSVRWMGQDVAIYYNPNVMNDDVIDAFRSSTQADPEHQNEALNAIVETLVVDWDIFASAADEKAGRAAPVDLTTLKVLPIQLKSRIVSSVIEAASADPEVSGEEPDGGSSPPPTTIRPRVSRKSGT